MLPRVINHHHHHHHHHCACHESILMSSAIFVQTFLSLSAFCSHYYHLAAATLRPYPRSYIKFWGVSIAATIVICQCLCSRISIAIAWNSSARIHSHQCNASQPCFLISSFNSMTGAAQIQIILTCCIFLPCLQSRALKASL